MRFRKIFIPIFILIFAFALVSCKKSNYDKETGSEIVSGQTGESLPNRKIIYKVSAELTVKNLTDSVTNIKSRLNSDEWLDSEDITAKQAVLVIRVKTEHLDEFLNSISESYQVSNFKKTATDISLTYQDKTNLILTYQAERDRLLELYDNASMSDMIQINTRISQLTVMINNLQGELNQFDSLVDYSEVTLRIYGASFADKLPFGHRVSAAFVDGFNALVSFLDTLVIVLATILPWMIIIAPLTYLIYRLNKKNKK